MPQLPKSSTEQKKIVLPSSADGDEAYVVIETGRLLGGDIVSITDPSDRSGVIVGLLASRIKEWNFTEDDGTPTPITLENVRHLELQDFTFLMAELLPEEAVDDITTDPKKNELSSTTSAPSLTE